MAHGVVDLLSEINQILGWVIFGALVALAAVAVLYFGPGMSKLYSLLIVGAGLAVFSWAIQDVAFFRWLGAAELVVSLTICVTALWADVWGVSRAVIVALVGAVTEAGGNAPWAWPPTGSQWLWCAVPLVTAGVLGSVIGLFLRKRARQQDDRDRRAAEARAVRRAAEEAAERTAAEEQRLRDLAHQKAAAERAEAQRMERESRAEERRLEEERKAAEKEAERAREKALSDREDRAVQEAYPGGLSFNDLLALERRILQQVYALSHGSKKAIPLTQLTDETVNLGQALLGVRSLRERDAVHLSDPWQRQQWFEKNVWITDAGRREAVKMSSGDNFIFEGSVNAGNIGRADQVRVGAVGAGSNATYAEAVSTLADSVAGAAPHLGGDAQTFQQHLDDLRQATTVEERRTVLSRVADLAKSLGAVAAPILNTTNKVLEIVGSHRHG